MGLKLLIRSFTLGWLVAGLLSWASAGEVDTRQYGLIQNGMREKEVRERLGTPDHVRESEDHKHYESRGRWHVRHLKRKRLVYDWTNPASGQRIQTIIVLDDGKVVDKKRFYK